MEKRIEELKFVFEDKLVEETTAKESEFLKVYEEMELIKESLIQEREETIFQQTNLESKLENKTAKNN